RQIGLAAGLHYVYTGNVHDSEGGSTFCPRCKALLIERDWYQLGSWQLTSDGCCRYCQHPIAGVFEAQPGDWGARRKPVILNAINY
ncbi:MAG: hypothetical protein V7752_16640, partial [Halopseudomonas sp.]